MLPKPRGQPRKKLVHAGRFSKSIILQRRALNRWRTVSKLLYKSHRASRSARSLDRWWVYLDSRIGDTHAAVFYTNDLVTDRRQLMKLHPNRVIQSLLLFLDLYI